MITVIRVTALSVHCSEGIDIEDLEVGFYCCWCCSFFFFFLNIGVFSKGWNCRNDCCTQKDLSL